MFYLGIHQLAEVILSLESSTMRYDGTKTFILRAWQFNTVEHAPEVLQE